ncbi:MAG: aminotransferase [Thermoanaerobaculia bacterium]|jgi:aspartate/methionine/tyrosine aminotransferase|nr:aminotransferase [Thermoanaerobaculia bacterium]
MMTGIAFGGTPIAYPPDRGFLPLRVAIAEYLRRHNGWTVNPAHVIVTNGGTQAIFVAQAFVKLLAEDRGGTARLHCITPTWMKLPVNQAKILGVTYDDVPLTFENGVWTVPLLPQFFGSAADVHMVFAVNPANPIGQVFRSSELRSPGSFTILDVTYESMLYDGDGHLNLADVAPHAESTFIVGSLSKTFAVPGLRIGYLICPELLVSDATDIVTTLSMGVSVSTQEYALRVLRDWEQTGGRWFTPVRDELRARADVVYRTLIDLGFDLAAPNAGYYAFAELPPEITESASEFAKRLLRRGVRIVEGDDFGGARFDRFLRISFGNAKSLAALKQALGQVREACIEFQKGK